MVVFLVYNVKNIYLLTISKLIYFDSFLYFKMSVAYGPALFGLQPIKIVLVRDESVQIVGLIQINRFNHITHY